MGIFDEKTIYNPKKYRYELWYTDIEHEAAWISEDAVYAARNNGTEEKLWSIWQSNILLKHYPPRIDGDVSA